MPKSNENKYCDSDIESLTDKKSGNNNRRVFERSTVNIKVGKLTDDYSVFYDPDKEPVTFKSIGDDRIISKKYVI